VFDSAFMQGFEAAVNSAVFAGTKINDKLSIGIAASAAGSEDAKDPNTGGAVRISFTYAVLTLDNKSRVTACMLDVWQSDIEFDYTGNIISDIYAQGLVLNQLGRERRENADALKNNIINKTRSEIKGLSDLNNSDFLTAINKAFDNIK
jgi:hypothetical protein